MNSDKGTSDFVYKTQDDVTIVRLTLENVSSILDVNRLSGSLLNIIDRGSRKLVLDLKHVKFSGSAFLGMLLSISGKMKEKNGRFILSHAETIEPVLKVSKTARLFEIAPDPRTAIEMIHRKT